MRVSGEGGGAWERDVMRGSRGSRSVTARLTGSGSPPSSQAWRANSDHYGNQCAGKKILTAQDFWNPPPQEDCPVYRA